MKHHRKVSFYKEKCSEFKTNSKHLWSLINNIKGKTHDKQCVISKLSVGHIEECNSKIIANRLAQHFPGIGKSYAEKIPASTCGVETYLREILPCNKGLFLKPVMDMDIHRIIGRLPNNSSSGWHSLSNTLIKKISK